MTIKGIVQNTQHQQLAHRMMKSAAVFHVIVLNVVTLEERS